MIVFWILALVLIASAVFTITAAKPVYSVVGLLLNFVALAALYLSLNAEFLAFIQILVYSGAILILFLFVIALLSSGTKAFDIGPDRLPKIAVPGGIFVLVVLAGIAATAVRVPFVVKPVGPIGTAGEANVFGSVADFGTALFTTNLLPFEITAFVLMVAVIGVVLLAGDEAPPFARKARRERESIVKPVESVK
jgi:NADH-quinone oxidoreductase subunit J